MPTKETRKKLSLYSSQIIWESDEVNYRGPRYNGQSSRSYLALESDMRSQFYKRSDFSTVSKSIYVLYEITTFRASYTSMKILQWQSYRD